MVGFRIPDTSFNVKEPTKTVIKTKIFEVNQIKGILKKIMRVNRNFILRVCILALIRTQIGFILNYLLPSSLYGQQPLQSFGEY
jgi:hypothetical protein